MKKLLKFSSLTFIFTLMLTFIASALSVSANEATPTADTTYRLTIISTNGDKTDTEYYSYSESIDVPAGTVIRLNAYLDNPSEGQEDTWAQSYMDYVKEPFLDLFIAKYSTKGVRVLGFHKNMSFDPINSNNWTDYIVMEEDTILYCFYLREPATNRVGLRLYNESEICIETAYYDFSAEEYLCSCCNEFITQLVEDEGQKNEIVYQIKEIKYYAEKELIATESRGKFTYDKLRSKAGVSFHDSTVGFIKSSLDLSPSINFVVDVILEKAPILGITYSKGETATDHREVLVFEFGEIITNEFLEEKWEAFKESYTYEDKDNYLLLLAVTMYKDSNPHEEVVFEEGRVDDIFGITFNYVEVAEQVELTLVVLDPSVKSLDLDKLPSEEFILTSETVMVDSSKEFNYDCFKNESLALVQELESIDRYYICDYVVKDELVNNMLIRNNTIYLLTNKFNILNETTLYVNKNFKLNANLIENIFIDSLKDTGFEEFTVTHNAYTGSESKVNVYDYTLKGTKEDLVTDFTFSIEVCSDVKFSYVFDYKIYIDEDVRYINDSLLDDLKTCGLVEENSNAIVGSDYFTSEKADGEYEITISYTSDLGTIEQDKYTLVVGTTVLEDVEETSLNKVISFVKENIVTIILGCVIVIGAIAIISKRD